MVAEEIEDAEYTSRQGAYRGREDPSSEVAVDGPSIGALLCESRSGPIVEYTLQSIVQPTVSRGLPEPLQAEVPSIEDLQEVVEKLRKELNEARQAQETDVEES
jgi:hypothetical protein